MIPANQYQRLPLLYWTGHHTGVSDEAVERLFQILGTPNLGSPQGAKFYENLFSVPNYYELWLRDGSNNPLKKFTYNKIRAFYLYDQIRNKEFYIKNQLPILASNMGDIVDDTDYTPQSVRRLYNDLSRAGYRDLILTYFGVKKKTGKSKQKTGEKEQSPELSRAGATFNPIVLAIYDAYAEIRQRPLEERISLEDLLEK